MATEMENIKDQLSQNKGRWTLLLWGLGFFFTVVSSLSMMTYQRQVQNDELLRTVLVQLSTYIAVSDERHIQTARRLDIHKEKLDNYGERIRFLENQRSEKERAADGR